MTDCKLWTGSTNGKHYGQKSIRGRLEYVHRLAYCKANGVTLEQIKGMCVLHSCDTPLCYNPDHLRLGTQADNVADMVAKGRQLKGEQKPNAKLTWDDVTEIRIRYAAGGVYQKDLAAEYGVATSLICDVVNNKTWNTFPR